MGWTWVFSPALQCQAPIHRWGNFHPLDQTARNRMNSRMIQAYPNVGLCNHKAYQGVPAHKSQDGAMWLLQPACLPGELLLPLGCPSPALAVQLADMLTDLPGGSRNAHRKDQTRSNKWFASDSPPLTERATSTIFASL